MVGLNGDMITVMEDGFCYGVRLPTALRFSDANLLIDRTELSAELCISTWSWYALLEES
jgi:hypothetical protein